jgi:PST family polysaccharide transporter
MGALSRTSLRRVVANTGWLVGERVFRMGLNFVLVAWMARYLGTEAFGQYNYVLAFVALFSGFATLGIDAIAVRDLLTHPQQRAVVMGSALAVKAGGGAAAYLVLLAAVAVVSPEFWGLTAIAGTVLLWQAFDVVDCWFQSAARPKYAVYARALSSVVLAVVRIGLLVGEASLIYFVSAAALELLLSAVFLLAIYRGERAAVGRWSFDATVARKLIRDAMPMLVSAIAIMLYMRIDQVMIARLAGFDQVGIYSAAVRLTELWYFAPVAFMTALFPWMMRSRTADPAVYQQRAELLFGTLGWMAIALAAVTSAFAPWLTRIIYGPEYAAAAPVLTVQAWIAVFVFFGVARGRWLLTENRQRDSMYVDVVGVVLNVSINLALIPRYGAMGAAIASLVTAAGANLLVSFVSEPIRASLLMYARGLAAAPRRAASFLIR